MSNASLCHIAYRNEGEKARDHARDARVSACERGSGQPEFPFMGMKAQGLRDSARSMLFLLLSPTPSPKGPPNRTNGLNGLSFAQPQVHARDPRHPEGRGTSLMLQHLHSRSQNILWSKYALSHAQVTEPSDIPKTRLDRCWG